MQATNRPRTMKEKSTDDKYPFPLPDKELLNINPHALNYQLNPKKVKLNSSLKSSSSLSSFFTKTSPSPTQCTSIEKQRSPFEKATDDKFRTISEQELNKKYMRKLPSSLFNTPTNVASSHSSDEEGIEDIIDNSLVI